MFGVADRSTDEPSSSSTSLRAVRTRGESVWITMPASALREHAGMSVRAPSSSTTQIRHTLTGVRLRAKHRVGVVTPTAAQASRTDAPSGTVAGCPSTVTVTSRRGPSRGRRPRSAG
jgi:hypothetical protein